MRRVFLTLSPAMAFPWHYTAASWPPANWPVPGREWVWIPTWLQALIAGVWATLCAGVMLLPDCFARSCAPQAAFSLRPRPRSPGLGRGCWKRLAGARRLEWLPESKSNQVREFGILTVGGCMKLKRAVSTFFVLAAVFAASAFAQEHQDATPAPHEIQMTAKKYEFNPNVITVKKGEHVKLVITATDRDHGFKLDVFKINEHLKKGEPATVEFTADKAGEFPFQCSVICGLGHRRMKGKLIVN